MRYIKKGEEPKTLTEYRKFENAYYDGYKEKDEIKEYLLDIGNLDNYQKPDAFIPHYRQPYYDMLINTDTEPAEVSEGANYNSNCQFGVCIPSSGVVEEP